MDSYDFRNRASPMYSRPGAVSGGGASMYPRVGQAGHVGPPPARQAPYPQPHPGSAPPTGLGIRVVIKPEYRITPPPPLAPQTAEVPRSTFHYDFDFEKKILAEAEKGTQNWSRIAAETQSTKIAPSTSSTEPVGDPIVNKYVASGLPREAVSLAVHNYGDNPIKVREFVKGYNLLREMGFSSKNVAEALAMYDNDTDKALAYFLNSSQ
ncbi:uncharacterized protein A4U43_C05F27130 [Asparagus officinalis]|uniref:UBA domain-containing protein n=1 Tax=Asparagus officinalis TaxID=4686 RepID=A0A5P1EUU1_ASPOF|nr:uncharacterized protein LOC109840655 [Asparagus officinalis]ONK69825.1 uncharacterized protein A4U43_C05F27130 [Asparagus officinalis]